MGVRLSWLGAAVSGSSGACSPVLVDEQEQRQGVGGGGAAGGRWGRAGSAVLEQRLVGREERLAGRARQAAGRPQGWGKVSRVFRCAGAGRAELGGAGRCGKEGRVVVGTAAAWVRVGAAPKTT